MPIPDLSAIETPALLIDLPTVEQNLARFAAIALENGVAMRPHIKTHKMPRFAQMQLAHGAVGLSCAKVSEAEVLADAGVFNIFIAHPVAGGPRIARVMRLAQRTQLIVGVDSIAGIDALQAAACAAGLTLAVRLEIDTGLMRSGVPIGGSVALARHILTQRNLRFDGIFTYKTANLNGRASGDLAAAGAQEIRLLAQCAEALRSQGIRVPQVSGGSTPTGRFVAAGRGITEVRPGTYIFNDCATVGIGAARWEDCAATVLATVISTPQPGIAIIDAGSKALSTDSALGTPPYHLTGYGRVLGHERLLLARVYEEHGVITAAGDTGLTVGQQLRIIPNHVCFTVNLFNQALIIEPDGTLTPTVIAARGCSQ